MTLRPCIRSFSAGRCLRYAFITPLCLSSPSMLGLIFISSVVMVGLDKLSRSS